MAVTHYNPMRTKVAITYYAAHDISLKYDLLVQDRRTLVDERKQARATAWAIISTCNTIKQLIDVWPETEPFTRDMVPTAAPVPAVRIKDANKILALP